MDIAYDDSVTAVMRSWIGTAIERVKDRWDFEGQETGSLRFTVVAEPPCPGHQDYMCTVTTDGDSIVYIRDGITDPEHPANKGLPGPVSLFFQEAVIHELSHHHTFTHVTTDGEKLAVAQLFSYQVATGEGPRVGTLADWNPTGSPWEDRIQEAVAEVMKDMIVPEPYRVYDNRTHWDLAEADYAPFVEAMELVMVQDDFHQHRTFPRVPAEVYSLIQDARAMRTPVHSGGFHWVWLENAPGGFPDDPDGWVTVTMEEGVRPFPQAPPELYPSPIRNGEALVQTDWTRVRVTPSDNGGGFMGQYASLSLGGLFAADLPAGIPTGDPENSPGSTPIWSPETAARALADIGSFSVTMVVMAKVGWEDYENLGPGWDWDVSNVSTPSFPYGGDELSAGAGPTGMMRFKSGFPTHGGARRAS